MMRTSASVSVNALTAMVVRAVARGLDTVDVVVEIDEPSPRRDCEIDEPIPVRPTEAADRVAELEREVERLRARLSAARAAGWLAACERIAQACDDAHRAELALARDYEARGLRGSARDYEAHAETAAELASAARRIASEGLC